MSGLPVEIKQNICTHLADILADEPEAKQRALGALRLTTRSWSVAPCTLLFRSLRVDVYRSRGLDNLFRLGTDSEIFRHVRNLTVDVNVYIDTTPMRRGGEEKPDLTSRGKLISIYRSDHPLSTAYMPATKLPLIPMLGHNQSSVPAEVPRTPSDMFRLLLCAMTRLEVLRVENAFALALSTGGEINTFSYNNSPNVANWAAASESVNEVLLHGFQKSGSNATELSITGHHTVFRRLAEASRHVDRPSTLSTTTSKLAKMQLHYVDNPWICLPFVGQEPAMESVFRRLFRPTTDLTRLIALDIGRSPSEIPQRLDPYGGIIESTPALTALSHTDYPGLKSLTLRSFRLIQAEDFTTFLTQRTPVLEQLQLDNIELERGQCWWVTFASLRKHCKLKRFRLVGSRLLVDIGAVPWYVGAGGDPRPQHMGDSVEHADLEAWVTGADVPDPREQMTQPISRVMVWNAPVQEWGK